MNSTLLARTARRLQTTSPSHSTHLICAYSVRSGPIPPKNAAQGIPEPRPQPPTSDNAHAPTPPSASTQNAPVDTTSVSGLETPATSTQTMLSLDFAPPEPGAERERTGAKSSKDSLSSIERRRRQMGRVSFGLFALGLLGGCVYLGREWTEEELVSRRSRGEDVSDSRWGRTTSRFSSMFDYFSKPIWQELLPPMLPPPHQKPYTLLLSIDDLLVTSTWDVSNVAFWFSYSLQLVLTTSVTAPTWLAHSKTPWGRLLHRVSLTVL